MGEEIPSSHFSREDFDRFNNSLKEETELLKNWFKEKKFSSANIHCCAGFELEAWLVDEQLYPASINESFLNNLNNPLVSPELANFNIEINSTPCDLTGDALSRMHAELDRTWLQCQKTAEELHSNIVMVGILPTLDNDVLNLANMSKMKRFRALNREILHRRKGKPLVFDINGVEHLRVKHRDVMMEAAATSFQIHLQVNIENSVRLFNASIAITGPLLALSANSPYLFSKDLWDETRIPVFEQAVAVGGYAGAAFGPIRRVTFGDSYIRESLFECFKDNLEHYPVLLPVNLQENDSLAYLRFHNGTVWRWNRPLIGFDISGKPHLRIEQRVVPAGPSTIDAIANAAFYYGVVTALAELDEPIEQQLPHSRARDNFYAAARFGLKSTLRWINEKDINARDLIMDKLLPLAYQGLASLNISLKDSEKYLGVIYKRVKSGQNGSTWQRSFIQKHGLNMKALTRAYINNQNSGEPVHRWNLQKLNKKSSSLTVLDEIPHGLLEVGAEELHQHLAGPTLLRLKGASKEVLFISVLLHGNETTGWDAVREMLQSYENKTLPRSVYIFMGNIFAAAENLRVLNGQLDFNRIWKKHVGSSDTPEEIMAADLLEILESAPLVAAIDIHNNTGINPYYACTTELGADFLYLATLFSRTVVYFRQPDSVLSRALAELCPATTVECGKSGDLKGKEFVKRFLHTCLLLENYQNNSVAVQNIDIFHTVAIVKVQKGVDFGFEKPSSDLNFIADLDRLNFQEISAGTILAHVNDLDVTCLEVINEQGENVVDDYFTCKEGKIRFSVPLMPSMLTLNEKVIRQDCLCYLMERLEHHKLV